MTWAQLHLVNSKGFPLDPTIEGACETAFRWVLRDNPHFDSALVANWAEEIGAMMETRGELIKSPKRYAYVALTGKVRDWRRTGAGKTELAGVGSDLEYIGDLSVSFTAEVETKVWFEQISLSLNERDRAILVLLTRDASTAEIAKFLNTSYGAAAKAIQRVKDRISAIVNGKRHKPMPGLSTGDPA